MWNHRKHQEVLEDDEDSWEVRAFAEDTRNIMATTWPPKSYSCSFCRREFRSAQALGGHMNVHRHDRARLQHHPHHQQPLPPTAIAVPASSPNPITTPSSSSHPTRLPNHHQELISVANGNDGLRLFYHIPNPNNNDNTHINYAPFSITHHHHEHNTANTPLMSGCNKLPCSTTTTSTLVSISSHPPNHNLVVRPTCSPSFNLAMGQGAYGTNGFSSTKAEESSSSSRGYCHDELDLELRLGRKSPHQNGNKKND